MGPGAGGRDEPLLPRNEPLLPRSASFGSHGLFSVQTTAVVSTASRLCDGDLNAVKSLCITGSVSCFAVGLLGVINVFSVLTPLHYLTCIYLLALSAVSLALELDSPLVDPFKRWATFWFRGFTRLLGRGCLYLVLGTLAAGLGDPLAVLAGLLEIAAGASALYISQGGAARRPSNTQSGDLDENSSSTDGAESLALMAFRRRVLFGRERMDSAELVALCLELGLRLDARARVSALAMLDPDQEGHIDEATFMAWWEQQQVMPQL
jgi:hypothetical protein